MHEVFNRIKFKRLAKSLEGNFKLLDFLTLRKQLEIAEKALNSSGFRKIDKCSGYKIDEKFYKTFDFLNPQIFYNYKLIEKICCGAVFSKSPYRASLCIIKNYPYVIISLNFEPKCKINKVFFPCYEFKSLSSMLLPDLIKIYNQGLL